MDFLNLMAVSASVGVDKIKSIPKRRQVSEGVLRSQRRVYDGVAKWHVRRTNAGAEGIDCQLIFRS